VTARAARSLRLGPGDPLDPRQLAKAARDLLTLGVFRSASIGFSPQDPSRLKVMVDEQGPYRLGYDLRYDDENAWSALVDGEAGNLFAGYGFRRATVRSPFLPEIPEDTARPGPVRADLRGPDHVGAGRPPRSGLGAGRRAPHTGCTALPGSPEPSSGTPATCFGPSAT
jgi:hypothetical protein